MSGADERRTDGGEHPLDVDARFADIVAHFHDGEPEPPHLVDAGSDPVKDPEPPGPTEPAHPDEVPGDETSQRVEQAEDTAATDWAARYERAAREELAAHEERVARAAREARIDAEIDRAVDGPDHHFVPQEPPPLPRPDLPGRLAWGAVLLGPLALVLCALLWQTVPPWVVGAVVTAIVAGFGYLVWRLPRTRDRDDPTDGAIV